MPPEVTMKKFRVEELFDAAIDDVRSVIQSPEYEDFLRNRASRARREIVSEERHEERLRRKVKVVLDVDLPAAVRRALGTAGGLEYFEFSEELAVGEYRWWIDSPAFKNRIKARGTTRIEAAGEARVSRVMEGTVEAKIFGVGGVIEKMIVDGVEGSFRAVNDGLRSFLARRS
jgi:hypothetical protein